MWKSVLLGLCVLAGCKGDSDAPSQPAPSSQNAPEPAPRQHARGPAPALPGAGSGGVPAAPSAEDRADFRQHRAERMRQRFDADGDGKITVEELKNATGRMKFDDAAAVDTNHDGVISDDELDVAMKARREQMREQWRGHRGSAIGSDATE